MDLGQLILYFIGLIVPVAVGLLVFRLAVYLIKSAGED